MSEYKGAILRNAILAAIGISLIISVAVFGSTVVTQFHSSSAHPPDSTVVSMSNRSSSMSQSTSNSVSDTKTSSSGNTSSVTSSSSSFPSTEYPPSSTVAQISFDALAFAYDNYSNTIFAISNDSSSSILETDATTNQVLGEISLPSGSHANSIVFDPANRELYYALNYGDDSPNASLIALNVQTNNIVWNKTGLGIGRLTVDPVHDVIYGSEMVHSIGTEFVNVTAIDGSTNSVEKNVTLFESAINLGGGCCYLGPLMFNPVTGFLYESIGMYGADGGFSPSLAIFDTLTNSSANSRVSIFGTFDFAYNPQNGYTYIANNGYTSAMGAYNPPAAVPGDNITILNGSTYVSTIRIGNSRQNETVGSMVYDSSDQKLFVANGTLNLQNYHFVDQNVTVIDTTTGTISQVIPVQTGGINTLFFDPANRDLYVASPNTIFVVALAH